jgi:hypothetical protein
MSRGKLSRPPPSPKGVLDTDAREAQTRSGGIHPCGLCMWVFVLERAEDHVITRFYCRPPNGRWQVAHFGDPRLNSSLRLFTTDWRCKARRQVQGKEIKAGTRAYLVGGVADGDDVLQPRGEVVGSGAAAKRMSVKP